MIDYIKSGNSLISIIIYKKYKYSGIKFFTKKNTVQQLGYMQRPKNYIVEPHKHKKIKRVIYSTTEILFIKKGKIQIEFFNNKNFLVKKKILKTGDIIMLLEGGHSIKFIEKSEIIEIKQGPYLDRNDKVLINRYGK